MRNKTNSKSAGFTLIEIMMVVAIIASLASIISFNLVQARRKGRDAKRIADLKQLDTAIQMYLNDNGHAPYLGTLNCSAANASNSCKDNDTTPGTGGGGPPIDEGEKGTGEGGKDLGAGGLGEGDGGEKAAPPPVVNQGWGYLGPELTQYLPKIPVDPCGIKCYRGGQDWFSYGYTAPGYEAWVCDSISCGLTVEQLNKAYAVYAEDMETQGPYSFRHGIGVSY